MFNFNRKFQINDPINNKQPLFFHPNLNRRKHNSKYRKSPEQFQAKYILKNNNNNNLGNINLFINGNNINYKNINFNVDNYDINNLIINNFDIKKKADDIINANIERDSINNSNNSSDRQSKNNSKSVPKNSLQTSNNVSNTLLTAASLIINNKSKIKNKKKDSNNFCNNNYLNQNYDYKNNFSKIAKIDLNIINEGFNLLNEFDCNITHFLKILKLIKINKDLELILNERGTLNLNNRKRLTINNNELKNTIQNLIDEYFNTLSSLYPKNNHFSYNNYNNNAFAYNYFSIKSLNDIFYKSIKIQICLFSWIYVSLSQLNNIEIMNIFDYFFEKTIKDISYILLIIFNKFIKEEFFLKYSDKEIIDKDLKLLFNGESYKIINKDKNSDILNDISLKLDNDVKLIKKKCSQYFHKSTINPFGNALYQLMTDIDIKSLFNFTSIILNIILYGEINKKTKNGEYINNNLNQVNISIYKYSTISNNIKNNIVFLPLPPIDKKYQYTLVLDLDETLIHYFPKEKNYNGMFMVRPYCIYFLKELNELFEIIIFSDKEIDYTDNILNILDINNNIIKFRLYSQHFSLTKLGLVKDLNKLGRDLNKVIIIDNNRNNYKINPNNGISLKEWKGDIYDTELLTLLKILQIIIKLKIKDVRDIISHINYQLKLHKNLKDINFEYS